MKKIFISIAIGVLIWLPELILGFAMLKSALFINFTAKLEENPLAVVIVSEIMCLATDIDLAYSYKYNHKRLWLP